MDRKYQKGMRRVTASVCKLFGKIAAISVISCSLSSSLSRAQVDGPAAESTEPIIVEEAFGNEEESSDDTGLDDTAETPDSEEAEEMAAAERLKVEVDALVKKLSDQDFLAREAATRQLVIIGDAAVPQLKRLNTDVADPEAVARIELAINAIESSELPGRIDALMRNPADVEAHGFHGWFAFADFAGSSRASRRLFTKMIDRYPDLVYKKIDDLDDLSKIAAESFKNLEALIRAREEITVADLVAMQYFMLRLGDREPVGLEAFTSRRIALTPYTTELANGGASKVLKRLTSRWFDTVDSSPMWPMLLGLDFDIPAVRKIAAKELQRSDISTEIYSIAMQVMIRFGDAQDLPLIEKYLDNQTLIFQRTDPTVDLNQVIEQRYCDFALAAALSIRDEPVNEYITSATLHPLRGFMPNSLCFPAETDDRANAMARYDRVRSGNASATPRPDSQ